MEYKTDLVKYCKNISVLIKLGFQFYFKPKLICSKLMNLSFNKLDIIFVLLVVSAFIGGMSELLKPGITLSNKENIIRFLVTVEITMLIVPLIMLPMWVIVCFGYYWLGKLIFKAKGSLGNVFNIFGVATLANLLIVPILLVETFYTDIFIFRLLNFLIFNFFYYPIAFKYAHKIKFVQAIALVNLPFLFVGSLLFLAK